MWLGPSLMYAGTPLALIATTVSVRRGKSRVISRSFQVLALMELAFVLIFTSLGLWAAGPEFFTGLFGIRP